jgi:hypothetical protein
MRRTSLRRDSATHLPQTTARAASSCVLASASILASSAGISETVLGKDNPRIQPISCVSNDDGKTETAGCLQRFKELTTRDGDTLQLNLANGKTKVYKNSNEEGCNPSSCAAFHIVAFYPSLRSFLVQNISYECADNELVSLRSGSILKMAATVPKLSPNGKYLVSVDDDEMCGRAYYDLAIWSTSADPPALELKQQAEDGRYENWTILGWEGDDRIKLKVLVNNEKAHEFYDQDVEAVRSEKGWKLVWGGRVDR